MLSRHLSLSMIPDSFPGVNSSWLLLGVLAAISLIWLWTKTRLPYAHVNIPPFPIQPWPIVGHYLFLRGGVRDKMKKWRKKTGSIYSLLLGRELNIIVSDFDVIKEIMNKHSDCIINTPPNLINEILNETNKGIVGARDENWKEQRAVSLSILRSFGMGKDLMAAKIHEEACVLIEKLAALKGQPIDLRSLLQTCVSNVICSIIVGERFQHNDPRLVKVLESVININKYAMVVILLTSVKQLQNLPGDLFHVKKWAKAALYITDFIKAYMSLFKKVSTENNEPQNFIAAYLTEINKRKEKGVVSHLSEANLIAIVRLLFIAGTESTSGSILWCLLYMLHNLEIQEKVYNEIEMNVGTSRFPSMADRPKLTYLNAVIMETQRIVSVVPTGLRREVSSSFEVRGFTFPEGSIVWPILDLVHHDENIWGDPENFRPERFIDDKGGLINREELIPFCIGRRVCIGESLARMEMFLFLSTMFQRFKFVPVDGTGKLPSLEISFAAVCLPRNFKMKLVPRNE